MPELVRIFETHKAEGLMILGLNFTFSDSLPEVQAFVNEFNITFPFFWMRTGWWLKRYIEFRAFPQVCLLGEMESWSEFKLVL